MSFAYLGRLRAPRWALLTGLFVAVGCTSVADDTTGATQSENSGTGGTTGEDETTAADTGTSTSTSDSATGTTSSGGESSGTSSDTDTDTDGGGADDGLPVYDDGCALDAPTTLQLNLPDGNSMTSPVQARMAVLDGWGVFGELIVRPWEFLNYYPFNYPPAESGGVRLTAELYADPNAPGAYDLQVGVSAAVIEAAARPPLDLTLVVDVSGSMKGLPLTMLRESGHVIAKSLREGDTISIVTWDPKAAPLLEHHIVKGPGDADVVAIFDALEATGGTDLLGGLKAGYALAEAARDPERINRVLLMSDGGAAADAQALDVIAAHAVDSGGEGIYLIGVGVGSYGGYQPALMDSVTDAGRGPSVFVGSTDEAQRAFGDGFLGLMVVGARDVRVQIILPPGFRREALEAFAPDDNPSPAVGQLLSINDALVYHERLVTCAPEMATLDAEVKVIVTYRRAADFEYDKFAEVTTLGELMAGDHPLLHKGAGILRYAEALRLWNLDPTASEIFGPVAMEAWERVLLASKLSPNDTSLLEVKTVLEVILKDAN
ncbi:MAG: VWA domain-containing protein [Nannocystaceae bacterium]